MSLADDMEALRAQGRELTDAIAEALPRPLRFAFLGWRELWRRWTR